MTNNLGVGGNQTVAGTLGVTGDTTLSTLTTTGLASLSSASVTNNLGVGGNADGRRHAWRHRRYDAKHADDDGSCLAELGVCDQQPRRWGQPDGRRHAWRHRRGDTTLSTLTTTGLASLSSASVTNNLGVGGNQTVAGTLGVTGDTTLSTLTTTGLATVGNGLTVSAGGANITGNSSVTGNLGVTGSLSAGATTLASLDVAGNTTVGGSLGVTGASSLNGIDNNGGGIADFGLDHHRRRRCAHAGR